jgi:Ca-activated chloride channel homolog
MRHTTRVLAALLVVGVFAGIAAADGFIVPIRPIPHPHHPIIHPHRPIPIRGSWAVKYHHVDIRVRDQVATVNIDQEFVNTGKVVMEVEYLFPVPPGAAIDAMTLVVDGKEFAARLLPADEARKIYESIVRKKKDPALLEYAGFGLYRTKAFPLEPGKPCKVLVRYRNVCKKDQDLVEVWYPLNTEKFSSKAIEDVKVVVDIKEKAGDITAVYSPTHDLSVERKDPRHVIATYHVTKTTPTTDFQVFYKSANEDVGATLLTHQPDPKKDGYFLLLVSPNPRSAKRSVAPKDVVVVFDHSGSMSGEKMGQAKGALEFILNNLNEKDRFNVVAYNDAVETFFDGMVDAGNKNVEEARERLDAIDATGGTNIHEALTTAMKMLSTGKKKNGRPAYIIFLTDGLATVGKTNEKDIVADTKSANRRGVRLFAFGVGYKVNVRLLDKLVGDNGGRSDYVKPKEPIEGKVSSLYAKIKNPVMTNLKLKVADVGLLDMYPRDMGDLFEGDQIVVAGRYRASDGGERSQLVITGMYEGKERGFEYPVALRPPGKDSRFVFVEQIWAVRRVGFLLDEIQINGEKKEIVDELVRLSTQYGIMTPYTSFLADETTRLAAPAKELRARASVGLNRDFGDPSSGGARAQAGGIVRQKLSQAKSAPSGGGYGGKGRGLSLDEAAAVEANDAVVMVGNASTGKYEEERSEIVRGVRNVGGQGLYRRGNVWVAGNAAKTDLKKDADKIKEIERFSEAYFELARKNTVGENQILASQRANEELVIDLRGQVYRIR